MRFNELVGKLSLFIASILVCVGVLEVSLRGYHACKKLFRPPWYIVVDSPTIYGLNPRRTEINSQGLRDDEIQVPKRKGTVRILILGDSIAYGAAVSRNMTFPSRLEALLRREFKSTKVINAAVPGYTAYNELQYYLTQGREFEPDIIIVAFCMNDVVNPRLHWRSFITEPIHIPDEAIPNRDYDLNHVLPRLKSTSVWEHFELYNVLAWRITRLFQSKAGDVPSQNKTPTTITGEDSLSIEVLLDDTSPEWRWLTAIYDQLHDAVQADGATLIVALFPLAYQLDEDYPFFPQDRIAEYCKEKSIPCIDLLPSFRQHPGQDIFLLDHAGRSYDIWHLTEYGHELSAKEILRFLQAENRLPTELRTE